MKKVYILFLIVFMFISCNGTSKKISQTELDIILQAMLTEDSELLITANEILDKRIKKYHLANDYSTKIQLLLLMKEFKTAYDLTEEIIQRDPDYDEMLTLNCVLAKKNLSNEESESIFNKTIKKLDEIASKEDNKNFSLLSSQLILSILYSDNDLKNQFFDEIMDSNFTEYEKMLVEGIYMLTEFELYAMFGII